MKQKIGPKFIGFLLIFITLISWESISLVQISAAPSSIYTVTLNIGDNFATKLAAAVPGGNRNLIQGLRIVCNSYLLTPADFATLKSMATSGTGQLIFLDLSGACCVNNEIPDHAFDNTTHNIMLQTIVLPNHFNRIGDYAFYFCTHLIGNPWFPGCLTSIGNYAFYGCYQFTGELYIAGGVTSIGDYAFYGCSGFNGSLTLLDNVTSIGAYAFAYCNNLTGGLRIPNSVTSIGSGAFIDCHGFNSLTLPNTIPSIADHTFDNCYGFTCCLDIPYSVTSIGAYAFYNCNRFVNRLTIPNSITSIGECAFYNCNKINDALIIPNSVSSIGAYAFYGCSSFTALTLPDSLTSINENSFGGLGITSIAYHGSGITNLDLRTWFGVGMKSLTTMNFSGAAATAIVANDFNNLTSFNFDGMTNLESVSMTAGKIDFSGGPEGAWYSSFTGTKNISGQRPPAATKKDYDPVSLEFNGAFTAPAPVWLTANGTDITSLATAEWLAEWYAAEVTNCSYTLSYRDPDGHNENHLDTIKPGNHTVTYSFSGYPSENYSRQYTVGQDMTGPVINIIKPVDGATLNISNGSMVIVNFTDLSGINYASLQVKMDDGDWTRVNLTGATLYYMIHMPLANGTHTFSFKINDTVGNETIQSVTFTWNNYRRGFGFGRFSF